jgi:cell division protein FtsL
MSQEKVDRYKEEKRNRKAIQAKKKRIALIEKLCGGLIVLALVCWIGYSVADSYQTKQDSEAVTADVTELDSYMSSLTEDAE